MPLASSQAGNRAFCRAHHAQVAVAASALEQDERLLAADEAQDQRRALTRRDIGRRQRLIEAIDRGLWTPKSNSAKFTLVEMAEGGEHV